MFRGLSYWLVTSAIPFAPLFADGVVTDLENPLGIFSDHSLLERMPEIIVLAFVFLSAALVDAYIGSQNTPRLKASWARVAHSICCVVLIGLAILLLALACLIYPDIKRAGFQSPVASNLLDYSKNLMCAGLLISFGACLVRAWPNHVGFNANVRSGV